MAIKITEVTRGDVVESAHYGNVVVTNSKGKILAYAGDSEMQTYMRSAAKLFQALAIFKTGAYEKFQFTNKEMAIMCASHYGEDFHQEVIRGLLDKMGYTMEDLLCGKPLSIDEKVRMNQLLENHVLTQANSDCSGKHCGFLADCKAMGWDHKTYDQPEHPLQQMVLQTLADFADMDPEDFGISADGCGVPVHSMRLRNMAMAYARYANLKYAPSGYEKGCETLFHAMNEEPEMLAGTGGFCTEFIKNTKGKYCGKLGAEAIYCIGVKDKDMGIVVKVADGNYRALYVAVMSTLEQLGLLTEKEKESLKSFERSPIFNHHGKQVGEIRPAFTLNFK